MKRNFE